MLLQVRTIIGFTIGIVLIWFPLSLYLNALAMQRKPLTLRKYKPGRRTFSEWLHERNRLPDIFDQRNR
jgi:hypothetical protein